MSAIYWRDGNRSVRLAGSERAHMGVTINRIFVSLFGLDTIWSRKEIDRIFPPDHYIRSEPDHRWARSAATALSVSHDLYLLLPDGRKVDTWETSLNTALVLGSDPLKLMARLHGQCEIHAYVEGPNRKWLAGVIRHGLEIGLMREGQGWDSVVGLLEESDAGPVVTDYSVCESFPNPGAADWTGGYEEFFDLPDDERWRLGLAALRERSKHGCLEMRPDMLGDTFGDRQTIFTILGEWSKIPVEAQ